MAALTSLSVVLLLLMTACESNGQGREPPKPGQKWTEVGVHEFWRSGPDVIIFWLSPKSESTLDMNKTYRVRIEPADSKPEPENSLHRILQLARDLELPDLAEQHDHYLYGTPKK